MAITKGMDKEVFNKFKKEAKVQGLTVDGALTEAMILWVLKKDEVKIKRNFLDLKPKSWGKGSERVSEQVDEILYGKG